MKYRIVNEGDHNIAVAVKDLGIEIVYPGTTLEGEITEVHHGKNPVRYRIDPVD